MCRLFRYYGSVFSYSPAERLRWKKCKNCAKLMRKMVLKVLENCAKVAGRFWFIHTSLVDSE